MTKQEPVSPRTAATQSRLRGAAVTQSVCPYCAIGCGLLVFTKATVVQLDLRGEQLGRRTKVDYGLVGDTKTTLQALWPKLKQNEFAEHLQASRAHYQKARKSLDDLATGESGGKLIHPQYVVRVLDEPAASDAIFSCDVGTPTIWAARYLTMNGQRRLLGSFNHGSMANALPQQGGRIKTACPAAP